MRPIAVPPQIARVRPEGAKRVQHGRWRQAPRTRRSRPAKTASGF